MKDIVYLLKSLDLTVTSCLEAKISFSETVTSKLRRFSGFCGDSGFLHTAMQTSQNSMTYIFASGKVQLKFTDFSSFKFPFPLVSMVVLSGPKYQIKKNFDAGWSIEQYRHLPLVLFLYEFLFYFVIIIT